MFAKKLGFKSSKDKRYRKIKKLALEYNYIRIVQSGYRGHSTAHHKVIELNKPFEIILNLLSFPKYIEETKVKKHQKKLWHDPTFLLTEQKGDTLFDLNNYVNYVAEKISGQKSVKENYNVLFAFLCKKIDRENSVKYRSAVGLRNILLYHTNSYIKEWKLKYGKTVS